MIWFLAATGWILLSIGLGILVGKSIALADRMARPEHLR